MPQSIWQPFREPATLLDTATIRPLYNLFSNSKQNAAQRLHPRTLAVIVSLVLHATPSLLQQRVLHNLIDVVRVYQSEEVLLATLRNQHIPALDADRVRDYQRALTSSLLHNVVRTISTHNATREARHTAAQLLSVTIKTSKEVGKLLRPDHDWSGIGIILQSSTDYVLRFLVADALRCLIQNGADRTLLWPKGSAPEIIHEFPIEAHVTDSWLLTIRSYLSDIDQKQSFKGR